MIFLNLKDFYNHSHNHIHRLLFILRMYQYLYYPLLSIIDYYAILFSYYWYHRFIHLPIAGVLYRAHYIGHHKREFPIRKLRANSYYSDGSGGWFKTGGELVFGIPIIIILSLVYISVTIQNFILFVVILLFVVFTGDAMHSSYHLNNEPISHPESLAIHRMIISLPWFERYQYMHDLHHIKNNVNFGFADYTMDKLFGTYRT
jgi:sterol desaturase/sphingolipid hydroxylase (fatty acid hydroxylase superfamily)